MENSRFKFRAWDKERKIMFYPETLGFDYSGNLVFIDSNDRYLNYTRDISYLELMQYTGLKDNTKWESLTRSEQFNNLTRSEQFNNHIGRGLERWCGKEIYEYMEIDNDWEVQHLNGCYVLVGISNNNNIIPLFEYIEQKKGQLIVTKEYTKRDYWESSKKENL